MNIALLYLLGTFALWLGLVLGARAVFLALKLAFPAHGSDRAGTLTGLTTAGVAAGVLLIFANVIPMDLGRTLEAQFRFPLIWVLMPYTAWFTLVGVVMTVIRLMQSFSGINAAERSDRRKQALAWFLFGLLSFTFFYGNPSFKGDEGWRYLWITSGHTVEFFRGAIPLTLTSVLAVALLAAGAMAGMVFAGRRSLARGAGKKTMQHVVLIAGSILFGIPFAWLVVTSFKEDRDIASTHGLSWTPYISITVPYDDPKDPLFEGVLNGQSVQATLIGREPDGKLKLDVIKPLAMRGMTLVDSEANLKRVPKDIPVVTATHEGTAIKGKVIEELVDGSRRIEILEPASAAGRTFVALARDVEPVRKVGLRVQNYGDALDFLPPETLRGLVYLRNTMILVIMSVIGTVMSCTVVAYAFSRLRFPGRNALFMILLSTMMLPGAVTLLPTFLIFRGLGWIDTLYPLWVPAFFAGAFNVFLLRQFFLTIPMELEDAAKIDGCSFGQTLVMIMVPQVKPAMAAIAIWTAMGAWNNFMGPLIYLSSPERMPIAYALQLFQNDRGGEAGLMMAFTTMTIMPVLLLFFFCQRYFIEGVTLSGLGGR